MSVRIESMGFATPALTRSQRDIGRDQARLWKLDASAQQRWERLLNHCGIERRSAVMPLEEIVRLTTAQRMRCFARHAPALAAQAIERALELARRKAADITDLIVVTCTGFESPGPLHDICMQTGLSSRVRASQIGFMGCFGGICGLDAAAGAALRHEGAVALLVCVELCSLHLRGDRDMQNMIASLLFADGAAALVVSRDGTDRAGAVAVGSRRARRIPDSAEAMAWRITDAGFAMTLDRSVPAQLERCAPSALGVLKQCAIHPGGAAILDAMERGAAGRNCGGLAPASLAAARGVLRDHGNMSSGSVFFVLDRLLRSGAAGEMAAVAFGPGLTVERVDLCAADCADRDPRLVRSLGAEFHG